MEKLKNFYILSVMCYALLNTHVDGSDTAELSRKLLELKEIENELSLKYQKKVDEDFKSNVPRNILLRLHSAADESDLHIKIYHRRGMVVQSWATVPDWRQESFYEQFRYIHRGKTFLVTRDKIRYKVIPMYFEINEKNVNCILASNLKLDQTKDEQFPPGTPIRWRVTGETWSQMELLTQPAHTKSRSITLDIKAIICTNIVELDIILENGLQRAPVYMTIHIPSSIWFPQQVLAPTWNGGVHKADTSELKYKNGKITGILKVLYTPDNWFPKAPQKVDYEINADVYDGYVYGTFKASGTLGEFDGIIRGFSGFFIHGYYYEHGDMGERAGTVSGRIYTPGVDIIKSLDLISDRVVEENDITKIIHQFHTTYTRISALALALERYPLDLRQAWWYVHMPSPIWDIKSVESDSKIIDDILDYMSIAILYAKNSLNKSSYITGVIAPNDYTFGPFYDSEPLPEKDGISQLPEIKADGPQKWNYIASWSVIGPFCINDDLDNDFNPLPEVLPSSKALYKIDTSILKKKKEEQINPLAPVRQIRTTSGLLEVLWSSETGRSSSIGSVWYAFVDIYSPVEQDVWISTSARDHGKLWINNRLVWVGEEMLWRTWNKRDAIYKVKFKKGNNNILFRCREDRRWTYFRFYLCTAGSPDEQVNRIARSELHIKKIIDYKGDGDGHFDVKSPPLVWDFLTGENILWSKNIYDEVLGSTPVAFNNKLIIPAHPHTLLCMDQENGNLLWKREFNVFTLKGNDIAEKWRKLSTIAEKEEFLKSFKLLFRSANVSPVTDGNLIWVAFNTGVAGACDFEGNIKWLTKLSEGSINGLKYADNILAVKLKIKSSKDQVVCRLVGINPLTGEVLWTFETGDKDVFSVVRLKGANTFKEYFALDDILIEPQTGKLVLKRVDGNPSAESRVYIFDSILTYGKLSRLYVMQYILDSYGQVGARFLWKANYGFKYDRPVLCHIHSNWLIVATTVQEDCKGHSPVPMREFYAYYLDSGIPAIRIKPLLTKAEIEIPPVSAGSYVYVQDSGGGSAGGDPAYGKIAIVKCDSFPWLVSTNLIPLGTRATPVFDNDKMFLVTGNSIHCIAVKGEKGEKYQNDMIAETLLGNLRKPELDTFVTSIPVLTNQLSISASLPLSRVENNRYIVNFIQVNGNIHKDFIAQLSKEIISDNGEFTYHNNHKIVFSSISPGAINSRFSYGHSYLLDGIGGTVAQLVEDIELSALNKGNLDRIVLYTILDNTLRRSGYLTVEPSGIEIYISGVKIEPYKPFSLEAGMYPMVVIIDRSLISSSNKLSIKYTDVEDSVRAYKAWILKLKQFEPQLKQVLNTSVSEKYISEIKALLCAIDEYKTEEDYQLSIRVSSNNKTLYFNNSSPPVPWSRSLNMKWSVDLDFTSTSCIVANSSCICVASGKRLICLSPGTGIKIWESNMVSNIEFLCLYDKFILTFDEKGCIASYSYNGTELWKVNSIAGSKFCGIFPYKNNVIGLLSDRIILLDVAGGSIIKSQAIKDISKTDPVVFSPEYRALFIPPNYIVDEFLNLDKVELRCGDIKTITPCNEGVIVLSRDGKMVYYSFPQRKTLEVRFQDKSVVYMIAANMNLYCLARDRVIIIEPFSSSVIKEISLPAQITESTKLYKAGKYVFITSLANSENVVIEVSNDPKIVWKFLIPGEISMYFVGYDIYIFGNKKLYKIASITPNKPEQIPEYIEVTLKAQRTIEGTMPVVKFRSNVMPEEWLYAGPFKPRSLTADYLENSGGRSNILPTEGTKIIYQNKEYVFRRLDKKFIWNDPKFTAGFDALDIGESVNKDWNSTVYFFTCISNDKPRYITYEILTPRGISWNPPDKVEAVIYIAGIPMERNKYYHIPVGIIPLLVQVSLGELKGAGKIWIAPRLIDDTEILNRKLELYEMNQKAWKEINEIKDKTFVFE